MKTTLSIAGLLLLTQALVAQDVANSESFEHKGISVLLSKPDHYSSETSHPTIIFLHGADRSNTKHHPSRYAKKAGIDFPFIVIAPSCKAGCSYATLDVAAILSKAQEMVSIDPDRIYLVGYSMGGAGTWLQLKKMAPVLAAATPLAPAGGSTSNLCVASELPIRVYHGTADGGYANSKKMVSFLKECGSNQAELISLEGKGHGIWPGILSDGSFYDWLLSKQKP